MIAIHFFEQVQFPHIVEVFADRVMIRGNHDNNFPVAQVKFSAP